MRPVCAFSPCMPRPQRPGPSRAWGLWGRAFPHLIPGPDARPCPRGLLWGLTSSGVWAWRRMPGA